MPSNLFVLGAGGHARVVAEVALAAGWNVLGHVDRRRTENERVGGRPMPYEDLEELAHADPGIALALGKGDTGERISAFREALQFGFSLPVLAHSASILSPSCTIGDASVVMAGAVVNAGAEIGFCCVLNTGCIIEHDCLLEEGAFVGPGAQLAGNVILSEAAFIGIGASVAPGVRIGAGAIVGAGSLVIRDVPPNSVVVGVPAKKIESDLVSN